MRSVPGSPDLKKRWKRTGRQMRFSMLLNNGSKTPPPSFARLNSSTAMVTEISTDSREKTFKPREKRHEVRETSSLSRQSYWLDALVITQGYRRHARCVIAVDHCIFSLDQSVGVNVVVSHQNAVAEKHSVAKDHT